MKLLLNWKLSFLEGSGQQKSLSIWGLLLQQGLRRLSVIIPLPKFEGEKKVMKLTKEIIWTAIITVVWCWLLHQLAIQLSK